MHLRKWLFGQVQTRGPSSIESIALSHGWLQHAFDSQLASGRHGHPGIRPIGHDGKNYPNVQLTSSSSAGLAPEELWGGGEPDEACQTCTNNELLGKAGGQSLTGDQPINPNTGDFTTSNTLFDIPTTGASLETTLSYSSELAEAQAASGATYAGYFSWGWQSTINDSASNNAFGQVTLDEPTGAAVTFSPALNDGCGSGDYQDFQKYTVTTSYLPSCARPAASMPS